jgi:curved DNA-binding protein CbpA
MYCLALMVSETHNAQMLRVSGHFSAVLDSHGSPFARVFCTTVCRPSNGAICKRSYREASTGSGTMTTLYDLLGALPGDDAGDLRKAFREAVKGAHPDIRPNDPEAALNFRLIIHAMEVLGDPDQRAAYDHLLDLARRELEQEQRAARIRNFAFAMIGLAGVSIVAVSAHILFMPMAAVPPQAGRTDELSRGPAEIASNGSSARPSLNDNSASREGETTKRAEIQDDFLTRWGANDINVPADQKAETAKPAEEQHHLTSRLDTNENDAAADRNAEIATLAKSRDDLPPPPGANDINVPADQKAEAAKPAEEQDHLTSRLDTNENYAAADRNAEIAAPPKSRDDPPPPPGANDINAPADRNAETATVSKEPETPVVHAPGPNPPARHDDAGGMKALVEPDDKTDPSAAMHAQGIKAYRNGDLELALADFNRAIALNPTFMIAYINRGIVLYRMGKLDRALADVARARQIDRAGRATSAAALHRRRRRDVSLIESLALLQAERF